MIKNISRGYIDIEIDGREYRVQGEALVPQEGQPDYVIFGSLAKEKVSGDTYEAISEETRESVVSTVVREFRERGIKFDIEM